MHRIIKHAIYAVITIILSTAFLFANEILYKVLVPLVEIKIPPMCYVIYGLVVAFCLFLIAKPFIEFFQINKATKLILLHNYKVIINGFKVNMSDFDAFGITFWEYRVTLIDDISKTVYLSLYY